MTDINLEKDYIIHNCANLNNGTEVVASKAEMEDKSVFATNSIADDSSAQFLKDELKAVEDEQGIFGKAWNGVKNFFGFGLGSDKVEEKIEAYENGEISYEEALNTIQQFDSKQEGAVNLISNVATGIATAGLAVATGGVGAIVGGALIGGATKAGLKTVDRATNNVEGDALDGKQILKDGLIGAVDGTVSAMTAGMIKMPVAGQTVKQAVKQSVINGAKAGAISGATTGATEYSVEAAFEDDVEFNFSDMLKTSAQNAVAGGVFGGVLGGITGGIGQKGLNSKVKVSHNHNIGKTVDNGAQAFDYLDNFNINNPDDAILDVNMQAKVLDDLQDFSKQAENLAVKFDSQLDEATEQINKTFSDKSDIEILTARAKGQDSVYKKLAKKYLDGNLSSSDFDSCYKKIGDAVGFRIQAKSLSVDDGAKIVDDILAKNGIKGSYDDFVRYVNGDKTLDSSLIQSFNEVQDDIFNSLKTTQMQGVVNQLVEGIKTGKIKITELNNYGDNITSYFTKAQIHEIVDAYDYALSNEIIRNDNAFLIVNKDITFDNELGLLDDGSSYFPSKHVDGKQVKIEQKTKGAIKDSGYSSSQMNTEHVLNDNSIVYGELQIRGDKLNQFADVEHIPYDIRTGKISVNDSKYSDIYSLIRKLTDDEYTKYNTYLADTYKTLRMQELGLLPDDAILPNLSDYLTTLDDSIVSRLDYQGLVTISKSHS